MSSWPSLLLVLLAVPATAAQPTKRPTDEERGRELYTRHCASCHGPRNHGDGPATAALVVPVPDLAGQVKADKATVEVVLGGKGPMPGFDASFENEDAKRVLLFMAKVHDATEKVEKAEPERPGDPTEGAEGAGPG